MRSSTEPSKKRGRLFLEKFDLSKMMVFIIFIAVLVFFALWLGKSFFSMSNLMNIIRQTAMISVMAVGVTFVMAAGQIDLSVSGLVPMTGIIAAILLKNTDSLVLAILVPILFGAFIGLVDGLIVTSLNLPAFLVTIGMQGILRGAAMWASGTKSIPIYNNIFNKLFGYTDIFGVPTLLIWTIVFVVIGNYALKHMAYGKRVLAIGGNISSARYSGIQVNNTS